MVQPNPAGSGTTGGLRLGSPLAPLGGLQALRTDFDPHATITFPAEDTRNLAFALQCDQPSRGARQARSGNAFIFRRPSLPGKIPDHLKVGDFYVWSPSYRALSAVFGLQSKSKESQLTVAEAPDDNGGLRVWIR